MLILTAFVNWIIIYMLLALYINSNILAAFIFAVIIGGLTVLSTTEHAEKLYRYMNGMRRATKREVEQIKPILDDLCQRAGIQDLVLCVADEPFPNAYALGSKTVCVTKGLLKTANEEELAGILAHELGHLKYGDSKRSVMAHTLNTAGTVATWILVAMATILSLLSNRVPIVAVLAALAAVVLKAMQVVLHRVADLSFRVVGRKEEFRADAYAVELGMGEGLMSFLEKIEGTEGSPKGIWARLEATHPPVAFRIEQIEIALEEKQIESL